MAMLVVNIMHDNSWTWTIIFFINVQLLTLLKIMENSRHVQLVTTLAPPCFWVVLCSHRSTGRHRHMHRSAGCAVATLGGAQWWWWARSNQKPPWPIQGNFCFGFKHHAMANSSLIFLVKNIVNYWIITWCWINKNATNKDTNTMDHTNRKLSVTYVFSNL